MLEICKNAITRWWHARIINDAQYSAGGMLKTSQDTKYSILGVALNSPRGGILKATQGANYLPLE